ncbi:hypothetical protein MTO96_041636 [Rhipicephalus appendiculatus]
MGSRPPAFDGAAGSWGTYRIRLEAFFEGHEVTDPGKRRALLISSLSDSVVGVLQRRNPSTPVNSLSYDQVVECLEDQYNPQANEIAASYAFFMRKQKEGESVRDFIAELRRLAESCNFGSTMDRMLRDRIVCGIRDDDARRSLLTQLKLTLKEAEDFARASEKAQEDVRDMQETGVGNGSGTTNALQRLRRCEYRPPSSNLESSRPRCERCDGPHDSNVCRHRNTKCRQCGRKGHLARVCHRSRSRTSGAYVVEQDESESEEFMLALVAHSATDRDVSRPLEKVLTRGGQKLSMIIDTGSPRWLPGTVTAASGVGCSPLIRKKENSNDISTKCDFGKRSKKPPRLIQGRVKRTSALKVRCHNNYPQGNSANRQTKGRVQTSLQALWKTRSYPDVQLAKKSSGQVLEGSSVSHRTL